MKKILLLLTLVLSPLNSFCKITFTVNDIISINKYIDEGRIDKAKNYLIKYNSSSNSFSEIEKIQYHYLWGKTYYQQKLYSSALEEFEKSIIILYNKQLYDNYLYLGIAYYMAESYLNLREYKKAESLINVALVRCSNSWEKCYYTKGLYQVLSLIYQNNNVSPSILNQLRIETSHIPDSIDVRDLLIISDNPNQSVFNKDEKVSGVPINEYIHKIDSICNLYAKTNNFKLCINTLDEAEKTLISCGLHYHPQTRFLYYTKGSLYFRINNFDDARLCFIKAKGLFEIEEDINSIEYIQSLNALALIFQEEGKYYYSTNLLYAALGMINSLNSVSKDYYQGFYSIKDNLARNYYLMGDKELAINTWEDIINSAEKEGLWSVAYSSACNFSMAQLEMGNYKDGIDVLRKFMNNNFEYSLKDAGYQNLLVLSYFFDDENIVNTLSDYTEFTKSHLTTFLTTFSEKERDAIWSERSRGLEMITNAICFKKPIPNLTTLAYNTTLYTKTMATKLPRFISDYVRNNTSSDVHSIYDELVQNKKEIIKKKTSNDSIKIISKNIGLLERELFSKIKDHRELFNDNIINCNEIKKRLGQHDVAIEFVIIPEIISLDSISYSYGAMIERMSYENPIILKLCSKDSLDLLLEKEEGLSDQEYVNELYDIKDNRLYRLLIEPLSPYINKGDIVYYSPIGMIHKLNLMAIPHEGKRIMDLYYFSLVSSTSYLLEFHNKEIYNRALVLGGIDYNESISDMVLNSNNNHTSIDLLAERSNTRGAWDDIPGSLQEAVFIDSLISSKSISSTLLTNGKANEEAIKSLNGKSPDILHIATHGFFYLDATKSTSPLFSDIQSDIAKNLPMQYCGLLFAGANNAWRGDMPPSYTDDGILNAMELSLLDFSNTKLAVLSACETGLGVIDDIDGVFGLQRGFKLAGVKTLIMSLWKIPDEATKYLMIEFYKNLMVGKSKQQSLKEAQNYLRKIENGKYNKPYYWASFIMLDGLN